MRIWITLALLAAMVGGIAVSANAYTCNTNCYGYGNQRTCNTTCF